MKNLFSYLGFIINVIFFPKIKIHRPVSYTIKNREELENACGKLYAFLDDKKSRRNLSSLEDTIFSEEPLQINPEVVICTIDPLKPVDKSYLDKFIKFYKLKNPFWQSLLCLGIENLPEIADSNLTEVFIYNSECECQKIPKFNIYKNVTNEGFHVTKAIHLELVEKDYYGGGCSLSGIFPFRRA